MLPKVLSREAVEQATGLPRSTIYKRISEGNFPKPIKLSGRKVGWPEADIHDWLLSRGARQNPADSNIEARLDRIEMVLNDLLRAYAGHKPMSAEMPRLWRG